MRYFKYSEFDQKGLPGSGEEFMSQLFLSNLDALRHNCGFPFIITSGYRSPGYNDRISSTGLTGPHTTGLAADIAVARESALILLREALNMECFTGIGLQQKGKGRFIHLDITAGNRRFWTY